jgi:cholesterol oxidase
MSFLMAMLWGMTGVRSAICSQVTVHPRMTWFHRLLVGVHTSQALQAIGYRTISPDAKRTFADGALDVLLRLTPTKRQDRCASAVCRWINTFYGPTHYHAQLNQSTHDDIGRLFGVADLDALDHIGLIVNKGKAVDHRGGDVYLPHVDRLRIPILFLAGDQNRIFVPATSRHTYNWLVKANGPQLYKRTILHDYAHLDGFIGRDAARDVYPLMLEHLEAHAIPRAGTVPAPALQP